MTNNNNFDFLIKLRQYLLTGVSYAIPFVACGGILIALSLAFAPRGAIDFSSARFCLSIARTTSKRSKSATRIWRARSAERS